MASIKSTELTDKGIDILEPKGNFVGGDETDELRDTIKKYSEEGNKKLLIDLGNVLYLNVITKLALIFDSYSTQQEAINSFE